MPYEVVLFKEPGKDWPPRIQNTFTGGVTTEEVVSSINLTINLLDQQSTPTDLIAIFQDGSSMFGAKGIIFQKELIDQLTWHPMLDQILAIDLNKGIYGSFLRTLLQSVMNQNALKVSALANLEELHTYLEKKYETKKATASV